MAAEKSLDPVSIHADCPIQTVATPNTRSHMRCFLILSHRHRKKATRSFLSSRVSFS
jgi:hypothetical protein